ncbi:MAG: molybdenum cofactor biosynthesis protein MoaE, partial [Candidatus Binatia bacterium]
MFRVTEKAIDIQELLDIVGDPGAGATVTFIGTTRNENDGRKVIALAYEGYREMAEKELGRIGAEAKNRWNIRRIAIVHRLGPVALTEPSVVIAVSAAHRGDAFEASRFAIEEIKKSVPIWKKELFEGGEIWIGTQSGEP